MDIKAKFESSLPTDHLHLLRFIADVSGGLGFPVYMVGGSVRDLMLDRVISDFDLTVEGEAGALGEAMLKRLGGKIMVHSKFGTARWTPTKSTIERLGVSIFQSDGLPPHLDFVSTRSETYAKPGALPTVKRSNIEADLRRRDFTINAMAIRLDGRHFGELVDVVEGQMDLERGLIRALHPRSFVDDPTRMFRAVRYAKRYEFEIEPDTLKLFDDEAKSVLAGLSGERLRNEFDLIFDEEKSLSILEELNKLGLLAIIHLSLTRADHKQLAEKKDKPVAGFGEIEVPDILSFTQSLGWNLYLMNLTENEIGKIAERLTFPVFLTKAVCAASSLYRKLPSIKGWKPSQWTFHLDDLSSLAVYAVWLATSEKALSEYLEKWQNVKSFTTGDDLKQLGLEPGPKYKEILSRLRAAWLDGEVKTKEDEIALRNHLIAK